jgi:hypothetical protein
MSALGVSIGTHSAGTANLTTTFNTSTAVPSGDVIVVEVAGWTSSGSTTIALSGGGLTWTQTVKFQNGSDNLAQFRAVAASGLASGTTLTVTVGAATDGVMASGRSYSGITTPVSVLASNSAAPASGTAWNGGSLSPAATSTIIGSGFGDGTATSSTPSTNYLEANDFSNGTYLESLTQAYRLDVAAGTYTPGGTWAASISSNVGVGAAYASTAGPPAAEVTLDAASYSGANNTTGTTTVGTWAAWTHSGTSAAEMAVVVITQPLSAADQISGVTYGGVAMTRRRSDSTTSTENGRVYIYELEDPPTGSQSVVVTSTGSVAKMGHCFTLTSPTGYEVKYDSDNGSNFSNTTAANPSVTVTHSGSLAGWLGVAGHYYGGADITSTGIQSGITFGQEHDPGAGTGASYYRVSTGAASSSTYGYTTLASDDQCISAVVYKAVSQGLSATVNQVTVTSAAQPIAKLKTKAIGQVTQAGTINAITRLKSRLIGQVTQAEAAQPVAKAKVKAIGQVTSSAAAQAIIRLAPQIIAIGQVTQAAVAQPIARAKAKLTGQVTSADAPQPIARAKARGVGLVTSTEAAQAVAKAKAREIGQVTGIAAAQVLSRAKAKLLGLVTSTETPQTIAAVQGATAYSLWTAAPPSGGISQITGDTAAVSVGTVVYVTSDTSLTHLRFYFGSGWDSLGVPSSLAVYRITTASGAPLDGVLLGSVTYSGTPTAGWNDVELSSPVPLATGFDYVLIAYYANGRYPNEGAYFNSAGVTSGPLVAPQTGVRNSRPNGLYAYGTGLQLPGSTFNGGSYFVDGVVGGEVAIFVPVSTVTETTTAQPIARAKAKAIGLVTQAMSALGIGAATSTVVPIQQVGPTNTIPLVLGEEVQHVAGAMSRRKARTLGQPSVAQTAQPITAIDPTPSGADLTVLRWNGSAWVERPIKVWDGSSW